MRQKDMTCMIREDNICRESGKSSGHRSDLQYLFNHVTVGLVWQLADVYRAMFVLVLDQNGLEHLVDFKYRRFWECLGWKHGKVTFIDNFEVTIVETNDDHVALFENFEAFGGDLVMNHEWHWDIDLIATPLWQHSFALLPRHLVGCWLYHIINLFQRYYSC